MYHQALYAILTEAGDAVGALTREMQGEDELFASPLTLRAVQDRLLTMAQALAHVTPVLQARLLQVDWGGWAALHETLQRPGTPPRDALWYAVHALVPQTLALLAELRRRQPLWFETGY
jgi:uncharacterized protein with HEPN domain